MGAAPAQRREAALTRLKRSSRERGAGLCCCCCLCCCTCCCCCAPVLLRSSPSAARGGGQPRRGRSGGPPTGGGAAEPTNSSGQRSTPRTNGTRGARGEREPAGRRAMTGRAVRPLGRPPREAGEKRPHRPEGPKGPKAPSTAAGGEGAERSGAPRWTQRGHTHADRGANAEGSTTTKLWAERRRGASNAQLRDAKRGGVRPGDDANERTPSTGTGDRLAQAAAPSVQGADAGKRWMIAQAMPKSAQMQKDVKAAGV